MNLILFFLYITFAQAEEPCPMIQDNITQGLMNSLGADQVWPGLSQILANKMMPTCKILEIGEYEDINIDQENSLTTMEHKYRLKRVGEKHYEVSFNLNFYESLKSYSDKKNRKNDDLLNQSRRLNQTWSDRVAECLKNIEGKTWGPHGEKVTFTLFRSSEGGSSPPKVKVQIMPMGRSNSHHWHQNIYCSTIVHELFHLSGLVDEYAESTIGVVKDIDFSEIHHEYNVAIENPAYDCRKIYEEHSIMANETKAWSRVMDGWWLRLGVCQCDEKEACFSYSSEKYKKLISQSGGFKNLKVEYPSQCPKGFSEQQNDKELPVSHAVKQTIDDGESLGFANSDLPTGFDFKKNELTFRFSPRPASHNNLLEPRHFNAIVYPGCVEKNHEYYQNSQNAYRTSVGHGGLGCADMSWAAAK